MRLNVCTKSSSGGSRRGPSCLPRKPPRCCSGLCWLLARSRCARLTAGEASPRSLPIRSLTSPHEAVISSRGRLRQTQFQHKSRRHQSRNILYRDLVWSVDFQLAYVRTFQNGVVGKAQEELKWDRDGSVGP